jgi:FkbM family methyltransferase
MEGETGKWLKDNFATWEEDTFTIFEQVKNKEATVIDIGAWIGTTAIWLSNNFKNVVAIESDPVSVDFLKRNLAASDCHNVTICEQPISNVVKDVVFGPRHQNLNESMSHIKERATNPNDIILRTITFDGLVIPEGSHVSFIKCDIEGGEEVILDDLLMYCLKNNAQAWVSFHIAWWTDRNISRFSGLFSKFTTNVSDPIKYIGHENGFGSILFTPKHTA